MPVTPTFQNQRKEDQEVQGYPLILSKFKTNLGSEKPYIKNKKELTRLFSKQGWLPSSLMT